MGAFFKGRVGSAPLAFFGAKPAANRSPQATICCPTFSEDTCCEKKERAAAVYSLTGKAFFSTKRKYSVHGGF